MSQKDELFVKQRPLVVDFEFDQEVTRVFPDMIRRSVPGYETVISLLGCVAQQYAVSGTRVYDLGCSLGAATLSAATRIEHGDIEYICADSSPQMLQQCRTNLKDTLDGKHFNCIQCDVCDLDIANASVVILNFTLQFVKPEKRDQLIRNIFDGLVNGGVLVVSEKIKIADTSEGGFHSVLHEAFKQANGYSQLEISQKRTALENVMILDSEMEHRNRFQRCGFNNIYSWFQAFNFMSLVAIKS